MGSAFSRALSEEDLSFLQGFTKFNEDEIRQWHKGFVKDCPSGHISRTEFREVYARFFTGGDPEAFCDHVFRSFDEDHSGTIDFREFLLAINITSNKGDPMKKLVWAFSMYDVNGNGTIDTAEMESIIKAIYYMIAIQDRAVVSPKERAKQAFAKMDIDGDGKISRKEFMHWCMVDKHLYQMLTADGDIFWEFGGNIRKSVALETNT